MKRFQTQFFISSPISPQFRNSLSFIPVYKTQAKVFWKIMLFLFLKISSVTYDQFYHITSIGKFPLISPHTLINQTKVFLIILQTIYVAYSGVIRLYLTLACTLNCSMLSWMYKVALVVCKLRVSLLQLIIIAIRNLYNKESITMLPK